MTTRKRGKKKTRLGIVVSDKMGKTVIVDVSRVYRHPLYDKVTRSASKCYVHDESEEAGSGDLVRIMECRPLSKLKRWRLVEVVKKHAAEEALEDAEKEVKKLQEELHGKKPEEPDTGSEPALKPDAVREVGDVKDDTA